MQTTKDSQEHIILILAVQKMVENWESRKKISKTIDQFIYPHLKDETK